MKFRKVIFYNQWRNGDCFLPKEYVRDIANRFPIIEFEFAHNNHPSIISDLVLKHTRLDSIPQFPMPMRMAQTQNGEILFINTWVGCWIFGEDALMGEKDHANFYLLHKMWNRFYDALGLEMRGDYKYYLPTIRYQSFNLTEPTEYINRIGNKQMIFFSNGKQQSEQSSMGDMSKTIRILAEKFKDIEFYATDPVDFEAPNLTVCKHESGFLNQLSYISRRASIIVGKNSGPFTYAHTKENISNPNKTFMCFSHKLKDCLLGEGEYICNSYFNNTTDEVEAAKIIEDLLEKPDQVSYCTAENPTREYNI